MSYLNGEPFEYKDANLKWNCAMCGYAFIVKDKLRFVQANEGVSGCPSFFVCTECDGDDILQRGIKLFELTKKLAKQWCVYGPDYINEI